MKTSVYYLAAATLMLICIKANAEQGITKKNAALKHHVQLVANHDSANKTETEKLHPEPAQNPLTRAMGIIPGSAFLQDIRIYDISCEMKMAVGYISGAAATDVGYMGFKVGDRVTWEPQMAAQSGNKHLKDRYFTGVVDLLDSNKCYIKIDHSKMVAVKLYEDISKVNP